MSVYIGDNGGIRLAPEVTYGVAGTVFVPQHARAASLAPKRNLIPPATLGAANPAVRKYAVPFVENDMELAYDDSRAVIGAVLASAGNLTTDTYTLGDGSIPDVPSLTGWVDHGGLAMQYLGLKISSLQFAFEPDAPVKITIGFLGQSFAKQTPVTITPPAETGIVYESDISTLTVAGVAMCALTGTIDIAFPYVGADRHCLGGSMIKEPQLAGRADITVSLGAELSNDTGADSEAVLDLFLAGTTLGDIVIGNFTIANCWCTGDSPALAEGVTQFPINAMGQEVAIVTTA